MSLAFQPNGVVTFLSDFGTRDSYVAEVKGALLRRGPSVRVVDVTHEVPRQDVRHGAFVLARVVDAFPPGTVHLAVVDPGVGGDRRAVVVVAGGHALVGPDNGLLGWAAPALGDATFFSIEAPGVAPARPSLTFHGRDLFAPVAAALAAGELRPEAVGPALSDVSVLPFPAARVGPDEALCEVVHVDGFGNLILSVRAADLPAGVLAGGEVRVRFGQSERKAVTGPYPAGAELVVHEDSSGLVEVAVPGGSAATFLGAGAGAAVVLAWR